MHKSKKLQRSRDIMNDLDLPFYQKPKYFQQPVATAVTFYLCGDIKPAEEYVEWFQLLRAAGELDTIYFRINSEGGDLFSALQLVRAIQESNATIVCSVEGICMSAATLIFLSADRFELSDHTMFMFHNYSSGTIGKGGEMYDQITHFRTWSEKLFDYFYKDFLTPDEIKSMLDNKDIWLDADEVGKRLKNRIAAQEPDEEIVVEEAPKPKRTRKKSVNE